MQQVQTEKLKILGVPRYRDERVKVREAAIKACKDKNVALELYSGNGDMSNIYSNSGFNLVVTVDKDKNSEAQFKIPAMNYLDRLEIAIELGAEKDLHKIDLVDFDAYGNPNLEVQRFFEIVKDKMAPIVVVITDGLGLKMKRSRDMKLLRQRFLISGEEAYIDYRYSWKFHPELTRFFMKTVAKKYKMTATELCLLQGKGKNFVFSSWLLQ